MDPVLAVDSVQATDKTSSHSAYVHVHIRDLACQILFAASATLLPIWMSYDERSLRDKLVCHMDPLQVQGSRSQNNLKLHMNVLKLRVILLAYKVVLTVL